MRGATAHRGIDGDLEPLADEFGLQVGESETFTDSMPIGAPGGEPDQIAIVIYRFVAITLAGNVVVE